MTSSSSSTIRRRRTAALLEYAQGLPRGPRRATLRTVVDLNCPVAERIARRYRRRGLADDDLRQAAYEGLTKAVGRFDPSRADDLLTFAVPTIRGEVQRLDHVENRMVLEPALRTLSGRDREIIRLRFTEELSQGEIGELIGVTQAQVSRLLTRILGDLRGALGDVDLRPLTSGPPPLVGHV